MIRTILLLVDDIGTLTVYQFKRSVLYIIVKDFLGKTDTNTLTIG